MPTNIEDSPYLPDMATMNCEKCNKTLDYYIQVYNTTTDKAYPERWCLKCVFKYGHNFS